MITGSNKPNQAQWLIDFMAPGKTKDAVQKLLEQEKFQLICASPLPCAPTSTDPIDEVEDFKPGAPVIIT